MPVTVTVSHGDSHETSPSKACHRGTTAPGFVGVGDSFQRLVRRGMPWASCDSLFSARLRMQVRLLGDLGYGICGTPDPRLTFPLHEHVLILHQHMQRTQHIHRHGGRPGGNVPHAPHLWEQMHQHIGVYISMDASRPAVVREGLMRVCHAHTAAQPGSLWLLYWHRAWVEVETRPAVGDSRKETQEGLCKSEVVMDRRTVRLEV